MGGADSQLGVGISGLRSLEGNGEVIRVEGFEEHRIAVVAIWIIGDSLVHDIPGVALALVVAHDIANVRLDNGLKGGTGPGLARDCISPVSTHTVLPYPVSMEVLTPRRQLAVPNQRVAPQELSIGLRHSSNNISRLEGERSGAALGGIPLHAVLGSELTELVLVVDDVTVSGIRGDGAFLASSTEVLETGSDGEVVELGGNAGRSEDDGENGGEMHVDLYR